LADDREKLSSFTARDLNGLELREDDLPETVRQIRARTPARLLMGRAGTSYRTTTQMELREAHAAARDAVRTELDLERDLGPRVTAEWNLFEVCTQAMSKDAYLLRPDLGRHFSEESKIELLRRCSTGRDLQIAIGDGLSVTAVRAQVPELLDFLCKGTVERSWTLGQPFVVRHCRVGILNEIGELLAPKVAVLLIGERPGLATAESVSAYMAYQPKPGHTDANRNLISNIHARGVGTEHAALRILNLAAQMISTRMSGYTLREEFTRLDDQIF
jgi:ethanolamine ammonia-lyase small subunit